MLKETDLKSYQNHAINFFIEKKRCALFMEMGLGKTVTILTALSRLIKSNQVNRVLIIAPLRVANTVWAQECDKWEHLNFMSIAVATGDAKRRKEQINKAARVTVINRENIGWLVKNIKVDFPWDCVIIDESSSFKKHNTARFRALKSVIKHTTHIALLTGTPAASGLMDLWSQLYLIDAGERLGRLITLFRNQYFTPSGYRGYQYRLRKGSEKDIKDKIKDVCLTLSAKDHLKSLPEAMTIPRCVVLNDTLLKQYKTLQTELVLQLQNDVEITSPYAASLMNKLLQFCNGAVYDEDGNHHIIHNEKITALKDLLDEHKNENFLVAYKFKFDAERILKEIPDAVLLSPSGKELSEWNKGRIRVLLAHPASAGHGLNAQFGGSTIIWFGLTWSLELYQQFNARLHRQGQKNFVKIIHLMVNDSVENKVYSALNSKAKTQDDLLQHLKRELL